MPTRITPFIAPLFNTEQPATRYILNAAWRILVIAIPLSILLGILFPNVEGPDYSGLTSSLPRMFILIVIGAPLLETLIMWPVIALIRIFTKVTWQVALVSALFWGFLHWLQSPLQGVVTTWSFFVMSVCFIVWRRHSLGKSYLYTACVHGMNNLVAFLLMLPVLLMMEGDQDNAVFTELPARSNYNIEVLGGEGGFNGRISGNGGEAIINTDNHILRSSNGELTVDGQLISIDERDLVVDTTEPNTILINGRPFEEYLD
jgi:hypothetical protein